jgi:hypothetical protein
LDGFTHFMKFFVVERGFESALLKTEVEPPPNELERW